MLERYGGQFDPDEAKIGSILDNFERLAKNGHQSRANRKQFRSLSDQEGTPAAFGGRMLAVLLGCFLFWLWTWDWHQANLSIVTTDFVLGFKPKTIRLALRSTCGIPKLVGSR